MNKSIGYYTFKYAVTYVLTIVILVALMFALFEFAPLMSKRLFEGGGGTGASTVTLILPPMMVAQAFYRHERRKMTLREGWGMAALFTVLSFVLSVAIFLIGTRILPGDPVEMAELTAMFAAYSTIFYYVAAGYAVFSLLVNKLMFWAGLRGAIKLEEKLAAKAARKG